MAKDEVSKCGGDGEEVAGRGNLPGRFSRLGPQETSRVNIWLNSQLSKT